MTQETIAIIAVGVSIGIPGLGGLVHIVWRLGVIGRDVALLSREVSSHDREISNLRKSRHATNNWLQRHVVPRLETENLGESM